MGKTAILKALALSQIVYVLSSLPTPKGVIKEINALLYDFLWDNKGDKIKRTEMINDYSKGGLKMIDIASFNQALKMKWVKSYLDDQDTGKWKLFFNHRLAQFGGKLVFWGNLSPKDVRLLNLRDPFLAEIMEYWTTLNYNDNNLDFTSVENCNRFTRIPKAGHITNYSKAESTVRPATLRYSTTQFVNVSLCCVPLRHEINVLPRSFS